MAATDLGVSPFRQSAIDRLSSPDQLDQLVKVADAKGWIALLGIGILVAFAVFWGIFGAVPTEVQAPGILVLRGGHLMSVPSSGSGMVTELKVRPGDVVKEGDTLASIRQTALSQRLADVRAVLKERQNTLDYRKAALERDAEARQRNADVRIKTMNESMAATAQRVERLKRQLAIRQDLRAQNLAVEERVEQARAELARATEDLSELHARQLEVQTQLMEASFTAQRELDQLELSVADAKRNVAEMESRLDDSRAVVAPVSGRVTEITTNVGATVEVGSSILNIETMGEGLQATVYIPIASGKRVRPGMTVHLEPSTVRREEFGMLIGQITEVSSFPSTPAGMHAVLQNQRLVDSFSAGSPPYEAQVTLIAAKTPTGYAWTSGTGPRTDLTSGTTVKSYIAVQTDPPIVLLLPFLRPLFPVH